MVNIAPTFTEFGDGLLFATLYIGMNGYEETEETIETLQITSPYVFVSFYRDNCIFSARSIPWWQTFTSNNFCNF